MKTFRHLALWATLPLGVYACAKAVEIEDEIQLVAPSPFSNVGDPAADAGFGGSQGSVGQGMAGSGGGGMGVAGMTNDNDSQGGSGGGSMDSTGGTGGLSMNGDIDAGGEDTGDNAGAGGEDTGDNAGAGGDVTDPDPDPDPEESVFSAAACDFTDLTGCEDLACNQCANDNAGQCDGILTCLAGLSDQETLGCVTDESPLCSIRNGAEIEACTETAEQNGVNNVPPPAGVDCVVLLADCLCQSDRFLN